MGNFGLDVYSIANNNLAKKIVYRNFKPAYEALKELYCDFSVYKDIFMSK